MSKSSKSWLTRHVNDYYVKKAKIEDIRSRSAYKLVEIQEKYKIIRAGDVVVDLGAAPGGWSEYAAEIVKDGRVCAIDLLPIAPIKNVHCIQGDFRSQEVLKQYYSVMKKRRADVVLSDMLHNTSGHGTRDHLISIELASKAIAFCKDHLRTGGTFLCKYLMGQDEKEFQKFAKEHFASVQLVKPKASRAESKEIYLLCKNKLKIANDDSQICDIDGNRTDAVHFT